MGANLISLGLECREIRIRKGLRMIDQAKAFRCSPSFISAVETGEKPAPEGYVDQFCDWLQLDPIVRRQLQILADRRLNVIRFTPVNKERAAIARRLFRKINTMTAEEIRKLEASFSGDEK
jgi:hypothetical protein